MIEIIKSLIFFIEYHFLCSFCCLIRLKTVQRLPFFLACQFLSNPTTYFLFLKYADWYKLLEHPFICFDDVFKSSRVLRVETGAALNRFDYDEIQPKISRRHPKFRNPLRITVQSHPCNIQIAIMWHVVFARFPRFVFELVKNLKCILLETIELQTRVKFAWPPGPYDQGYNVSRPSFGN
jgi:hypothetical protein